MRRNCASPQRAAIDERIGHQSDPEHQEQKVVIGDVLDDAGRDTADKLGSAGCFVHLDVADPDQWEQAVHASLDRFGRLDGLVNNAGIVKMGPLRGSSLSDWQRVLDVNLTGAYLGMRAAIEPMIASGAESIVNVSSVEGLAGSAHLHAYVAAKFGLRGITKSAAVELAQYNIRVNSIHPGLVHTPMSRGVTEDFMAPIPMRRGRRRRRSPPSSCSWSAMNPLTRQAPSSSSTAA